MLGPQSLCTVVSSVRLNMPCSVGLLPARIESYAFVISTVCWEMAPQGINKHGVGMQGLELNRDQVHTLSAFKMGPMATEDGTAISARTIVFAQYGAVAMPETSVDASSMRPAADVQNTTLWCGDTWELARPTAIKALELASDALAEAAGTPVDGGGGSSNNDARSFMIGTFVLACLGVQPHSECLTICSCVYII